MPQVRKPKIVVIVGPTASGKSDLAVQLAKKFNGEVVSADSRQVYRGMHIGTGKITAEEAAGVPHHLLNIASPKRTFTVRQYVAHARKTIANIIRRGKLPIVCGGTGFYIQTLVDGITIPEVPPNPNLRRKLGKKSAEELFLLLQRKDPERAAAVDPKNKRRIIRALEIIASLGKVPTLRKTPRYQALFIGIALPPEILRERIRKRLRKRLAKGLVEEVRHLHENVGLSWQRLEAFGLEYRYIARYLQGKLSYGEMVRELERAIWHYAKRQMTWFKKDKRIIWITAAAEAARLVAAFMKPDPP